MVGNRPRPFFDTNVIFSGFYSPLGPSAQILEAHVLGEIAAIVSTQVIEELITNIQDKKADVLPKVQAFLALVPFQVAPDPTDEEVEAVSAFINLDDAPILAAAIKCQADCIVTGNSRHFTPEVARKAGMSILSPAQYLAALRASRDQ